MSHAITPLRARPAAAAQSGTTPAEAAIAAFGGAPAVAAVLGVHVTRVYRYTYPRARGGTGGLIPAEHLQRLLATARARGLPLTAEALIGPAEALIGPGEALIGPAQPDVPAQPDALPPPPCQAPAAKDVA